MEKIKYNIVIHLPNGKTFKSDDAEGTKQQLKDFEEFIKKIIGGSGDSGYMQLTANGNTAFFGKPLLVNSVIEIAKV